MVTPNTKTTICEMKITIFGVLRVVRFGAAYYR